MATDLSSAYAPGPKPDSSAGQAGFPTRPLALVGLVALAILGILLAILSGRQTTVWIANGTAVDYSVTIGDETHAVPARGFSRVLLPVGPHTLTFTPPIAVPDYVDVTSAPPPGRTPGEPLTFEVVGGLWNRLFTGTRTIVNPDGAAALYYEFALYGNAALRDDELIEPAFVHAITDSEHILTDPPLTTEANFSSGATLRVVRQFATNDFEELHAALSHAFGAAVADRAILRRILFEGADNLYARQQYEKLTTGEGISPPAADMPDPRYQADTYVPPHDFRAVERQEQMDDIRARYDDTRRELEADLEAKRAAMRDRMDAMRARIESDLPEPLGGFESEADTDADTD